jgi:hypothetical protein
VFHGMDGWIGKVAVKGKGASYASA